MNKVTILIPAFNASKTIKETLDSIQNIVSDFDSIKSIYVSDDCSTDNTVEIVNNTWKSAHAALTLFKSEKNCGEWNNVNHCLTKLISNYDWVLLLHADDIAKPNWLKEMMCGIKSAKDKTASICSSYDVLHLNGKIEKGSDENGKSIIVGNQKSIKDTLNSGTWWHVSGCALNCIYLSKFGFFYGKMRQYCDMEFLLRIFTNGYDVEYIPKSLTMYRQISTSVSSISFIKHTDIYEFANLIVYYRNLFNKKEIIKIYLRFNKQLFRRNLRSLKEKNWERLLLSLKMSSYLFRLFFITKNSSINLKAIKDA